MDLSLEILEMVVLKLDSVEDMISLGSSCTYFTRIVGQERPWRITLSKMERMDGWQMAEDRVRNITTFLTSINNSDAIFSLLHEMIYKHYPGREDDEDYDDDDKEMDDMESDISVSFPPSPQLHSVSAMGLELLALTGRDGARHLLHKVRVGYIHPSLLLSLASLKREQISELHGLDVHCTTDEAGRALVSLLEKSSTWRVDFLNLAGEVGGQTWEGLAREVARGRLVGGIGKGRGGGIYTSREVVRRGRREDLRTVWDKTEVAWSVDEKYIWYMDEREEGWEQIEKIIV